MIEELNTTNRSSNIPPRHPRRWPWVLSFVAAVIVGGGGATLLVSNHPGSAPTPSLPKPVATLSVDFPTSLTTPNSTTLSPTLPIIVSNARLTSVSVTTGRSHPVAGAWNQTSWRPLTPLAWSTEYTIHLTAKTSVQGKLLTKSFSFQTPASPVTLPATVSPSNGEQVGMGAVWVVQFQQPLSPSEQAAVMSRLQTTATTPEIIGWHWWSATEVDGRPQNFWPLNDTATLHLDLNGLLLNGHPVIDSNQTVSFTVNETHEIQISAKTDRMLVYNNNQLIQNFPVSLGRPGFPTISGTLIVLYKEPVVFMNSATIGYPGIYAENVYQDVAISTDGYYMHSAPWDVYDHGRYNVSFGCVEQDPANATWIYNWSEPGDVVIITGTTLQASEADGEGDWNTPWSAFTVVASPPPTAAANTLLG
jgi:lipoprotein-anchoring transpeptidase ErfK/SrfK